MQWFSFPLPISWDEVATIATSAAVIVALFANVNSNKQLKKALQMHEQTKSVALFDRKLALIEKVKNNKPISLIELRLLFDEEIFQAMAEYSKSHMQLKQCMMNEHNFWFFFNEKYKYDAKKQDELHRRLRSDGQAVLNMRENGISNPNMEKEFKNLCEENIMQGSIFSHKLEEPLNYYHIVFDLDKAQKMDKENKSMLLDKMEKHIANSIQTIS